LGGNVYALTDAFEIFEDWNVSGMRGSGSHDVHLDNVSLPVRAPDGANSDC